MRWITLLPFSAKTTIRISILMIMLPHEAWVSAGLSAISKNTPVPHQCNSLWESESIMLRCYLKQQLIPSMRFLKLSDMITSFISAGFSTSWKDIHQENTERFVFNRRCWSSIIFSVCIIKIQCNDNRSICGRVHIFIGQFQIFLCETRSIPLWNGYSPRKTDYFPGSS